MTKLQSLGDAITANVADGDTVFFGGFGHAIPFAAAHELIRQGRRRLTLCRSGADIVFDQLVAAGCATRVIVGWIGNPGIGLAHAFRRALAAGDIELEEWTNLTLVLRLHAAALGLPFLPTRVMRGGDVAAAAIGLGEVTDPFSGERLAAVPALAPDVALIHAQRADEEGNVQLWGVIGDTLDGALASGRIVVSVEEVVPNAEVRSAPNRTVLPAHRVSAVCHVPGGAHPSYVQDYYTRDDDFYRRYDDLSRTPEGLSDYLQTHVMAVADRAAYLEKVDLAALRRPLSGGRGPAS